MKSIKKPFCPACGETRNGAFCTTCGHELIEGIRVCECGYDNIWPHEHFCQNCGKVAPPMPTLAVIQEIA